MHITKKQLVTLTLLLSIVAVGLFIKFVDKPPVTVNNASIKQESTISNDTYFANCLRTSFDTYANKKYSELDPIVIDGLGDKTTGLKNFDMSYYLSKFAIYQMYNSPAGGKQLDIVFVDKPDKLFTAWAYKLADSSCELRGFGENTHYTPELFNKFIASIKSKNAY